MRCSKLMWAALMATFAVLAAISLAVHAAPSSQDESGGSQQVADAAGSDVAMPSLFDFEAYKRVFKRSYSGLLENMVRFKYFTSRAIRASISAIKFRFRFLKFHLAINHMSDKTQEELDRMRNMAIESEFDSGEADTSNDLPEFIPGDDENVVATLRRLIDDNAGKPEYEALREQLEQVDTARKQQKLPSARRRKREVELAELGPRELPLSKMINVAPDNPDAELLPAETRAKIRARPESNNPLYEGLELPTQGLKDQQVKLRRRYFKKPPNLLDNLTKSLDSLRLKYLFLDEATVAAVEQAKLPNEVFTDLRQTNCLFTPRAQGDCGSCYAFVVTTVAEWIHCHTTGELVALSEQYMVDCAGMYQSETLHGCKGGKLRYANNFFQNFGWELRSAYPYMAREQQCPYAPDTDLRTVGYLRVNLRNAMEYHISAWPDALKAVGPLAVQMSTGDAFHEYGSGVFDGCVPNKSTHGVVLIGHGREDGEEYWLIRNSYSVGWGEAGHMRLAKKADCIWPRTGWSWGTDDGFNLRVKPFKNSLNDGEVVKKHYAQQVKDTFLGGKR